MSSQSPQTNSEYPQKLPSELRQFLEIQQQLQIFQDPSKLNLQNLVSQQNKLKNQINHQRQQPNNQNIQQQDIQNSFNDDKDRIQLNYQSQDFSNEQEQKNVEILSSQRQNNDYNEQRNKFKELKERFREKRRQLKEFHKKYHEKKLAYQQNNSLDEISNSQLNSNNQTQDNKIFEEKRKSEKSKCFFKRHHSRCAQENTNQVQDGKTDNQVNDSQICSRNSHCHHHHHHRHHHNDHTQYEYLHHQWFYPFTQKNEIQQNNNQENQQGNNAFNKNQSNLKQENIAHSKFCQYYSNQEQQKNFDQTKTDGNIKSNCFFNSRWYHSQDQNSRNQFYCFPHLLLMGGIFYLGIKFGRKTFFCMKQQPNSGYFRSKW